MSGSVEERIQHHARAAIFALVFGAMRFLLLSSRNRLSRNS
jgi:hypothetical protein